MSNVNFRAGEMNRALQNALYGNAAGMVSAKRPKLPPYYTIGVRFVDGHNVTKIYTYRVRKARKVKHGDLLVADTERGPTIVAVVRIDSTLQDTGSFDYKFITSKVANL